MKKTESPLLLLAVDYYLRVTLSSSSSMFLSKEINCNIKEFHDNLDTPSNVDNC